MLDRRVAPVFDRNFSFQLINPEHVSLPNGAEVIFVNGGDQNVIKVELIFPSGRWYEKQYGASYFTTQLLTKGTSTKTSFEIASAFDQLGAHFEAISGVDYITLSFYSLIRNLTDGLDLMTEIISGSIFPEKEIQQLKSIYTQNLRVNQEKTSFLASRLFKKTIYGEHHPYGKELNEEDVRRIDRNGLVQFYNKALGEFKVIVSGKIGAERKTKILDSFASLSNRQIEKTDHHPEPSPRYKHHADKENSIQSSLRVGKRVIGRTHPDYAYLLFVNHILGGYFGSRLMKNIREEKGLTYGIYSSIHAMAHDSYLAIGTDVNKENRELAFRGIKSEINRLSEEMISDEELDTARYHFIGSFQTELSTAFAHADKIKSIVLFNLGKDHYNSLLEKINKATAEDLRVVAKKYLENNFYEISAG